MQPLVQFLMIPLHKRHFATNEKRYLNRVLANDTLRSADFSRAAEMELSRILGVQNVFLTNSCTSALLLAGLVSVSERLPDPPEIIMPSFAFASCASVFALLGWKLAFADCDEDMNIEAASIEALIGPNTRAIMVLHYAGRACALEKIIPLANKYSLLLIEDSAHAIAGTTQGRALGTLGTFGAFSFDHAKNCSIGEGGVIVTRDPERAEAIMLAVDRGTNRKSFMDGIASRYEWIGVGGNFAMSEMQAAMLLAQLEDLEVIQYGRERVFCAYRERLFSWCKDHNVGYPAGSQDGCDGYHIFYLLMPNKAIRDGVICKLKRSGIEASAHYTPLHVTPGGKRYGRFENCSRTEDLSGRLLRLPCYSALQESEIDLVCETIMRSWDD